MTDTIKNAIRTAVQAAMAQHDVRKLSWFPSAKKGAA